MSQHAATMSHDPITNPGVLFSSSLAYLTALEFKRNSAAVSVVLTDSKDILDNRGKKVLPPPRKLEYDTRDDVAETFKDLWNEEIIKGANKVYDLVFKSNVQK